MRIILIGLLVFLTISFMFKSDWIIQETERIDFSLWIENYELNNITNDESDQNIQIVFISLIKHFLACTFKEKDLTFKLLKAKITKFNRMRSIRPITN
ncbi:hypothetical protein [Mesoplasma melaleucae]|uniref:hypothetical protein n=1 Tax=Mesoplasma melaleucae TaxID=81459 RepID=UPI0004870F98|nr:hypothetical protein [Mesoplasma melaleucae]